MFGDTLLQDFACSMFGLGQVEFEGGGYNVVNKYLHLPLCQLWVCVCVFWFCVL